MAFFGPVDIAPPIFGLRQLRSGLLSINQSKSPDPEQSPSRGRAHEPHYSVAPSSFTPPSESATLPAVVFFLLDPRAPLRALVWASFSRALSTNSMIASSAPSPVRRPIFMILV